MNENHHHPSSSSPESFSSKLPPSIRDAFIRVRHNNQPSPTTATSLGAVGSSKKEKKYMFLSQIRASSNSRAATASTSPNPIRHNGFSNSQPRPPSAPASSRPPPRGEERVRPQTARMSTSGNQSRRSSSNKDPLQQNVNTKEVDSSRSSLDEGKKTEDNPPIKEQQETHCHSNNSNAQNSTTNSQPVEPITVTFPDNDQLEGSASGGTQESGRLTDRAKSPLAAPPSTNNQSMTSIGNSSSHNSSTTLSPKAGGGNGSGGGLASLGGSSMMAGSQSQSKRNFFKALREVGDVAVATARLKKLAPWHSVESLTTKGVDVSRLDEFMDRVTYFLLKARGNSIRRKIKRRRLLADTEVNLPTLLQELGFQPSKTRQLLQQQPQQQQPSAVSVASMDSFAVTSSTPGAADILPVLETDLEAPPKATPIRHEVISKAVVLSLTKKSLILEDHVGDSIRIPLTMITLDDVRDDLLRLCVSADAKATLVRGEDDGGTGGLGLLGDIVGADSDEVAEDVHFSSDFTLTFTGSDATMIGPAFIHLYRSRLSLLRSALSQATKRKLRILHFNDVYHLVPNSNKKSGIIGGAARFATKVKEIQKSSNPLILFSGDFMSPSLMSVLMHGRQMIDAFNSIGVHYGTYGNHEFDYGLKALDECIFGSSSHGFVFAGSETKWIMSNMKGADGETPINNADPYALFEWDGVRVGILGLSENWLPSCSQLKKGESHYEDVFEVGEKMAQMLLSKGAEIVIALTHNRYANDKEMSLRCPSIDLILGGHDHFYKNQPAKRIVKSGEEFEFLTQLDVQFYGADDRSHDLFAPNSDGLYKSSIRPRHVASNPSGTSPARTPKSTGSQAHILAPPSEPPQGNHQHMMHRRASAAVAGLAGPLIPGSSNLTPLKREDRIAKINITTHPITANILEDKVMQMKIERYLQRLNIRMQKVIGVSTVELDATEACCRFKEGLLPGFFCDVMAMETKSDFAVLGGAAIAGKQIKPPGDICVGDVFNWFPNDTRIMKVKLRGKHVKQLLDAMVREVPQEAPSFPQCSQGLRFTINLMALPPTVESIFIKGLPMVDDHWYTIAVEDFVGKGKAKYKFVPLQGEVLTEAEYAEQITYWIINYFESKKGDLLNSGPKASSKKFKSITKNIVRKKSTLPVGGLVSMQSPSQAALEDSVDAASDSASHINLNGSLSTNLHFRAKITDLDTLTEMKKEKLGAKRLGQLVTEMTSLVISSSDHGAEAAGIQASSLRDLYIKAENSLMSLLPNNCDHVTLYHVDKTTNRFWYYPKMGDQATRVFCPLDCGIVGTTYATEQIVLAENATEHPQYDPEAAKLGNYKPKNILSCPIIHAGECIAVAQVMACEVSDPFDCSDSGLENPPSTGGGGNTNGTVETAVLKDLPSLNENSVSGSSAPPPGVILTASAATPGALVPSSSTATTGDIDSSAGSDAGGATRGRVFGRYDMVTVMLYLAQLGLYVHQTQLMGDLELSHMRHRVLLDSAKELASLTDEVTVNEKLLRIQGYLEQLLGAQAAHLFLNDPVSGDCWTVRRIQKNKKAAAVIRRSFNENSFLTESIFNKSRTLKNSDGQIVCNSAIGGAASNSTDDTVLSPRQSPKTAKLSPEEPTLLSGATTDNSNGNKKSVKLPGEADEEKVVDGSDKNDTTSSTRSIHKEKDLGSNGDEFKPKTALYVPVFVPQSRTNEVLGCIAIYNKKNGGNFTNVDEDIAQAFAAFAAISLHTSIEIEALRSGVNRSELQKFPVHELGRIVWKRGWGSIRSRLSYIVSEKFKEKLASADDLEFTLEAHD